MDEELRSLRHEVRRFLAEELEAGTFEVTADSWLHGWDEDFSRRLAARGYVGMTIPVEYGGRGRSHLERFVVTEELLAVGAPVAAHWISDRQIAPSLLRYGSDEQRQRYLPAIARGECYFAIGMSEPDAGSDLAAVRTRATRVDGGWLLSGRKVWTSNAHRAHAFIALVRTTPRAESGRHEGLTQLIVHLDAPGVTVLPIRTLDGESNFNEVVFDDVLVPEEDRLGEVGNGWRQVTSELGFERSGPERFLSTFPALARLVEASRTGDAVPDQRVGRSLARMSGLHQLSFQVAERLQEHRPADVPAAMVKVMGTLHEGDLADLVAEHAAAGPASADPVLRELADLALLRRPGFTLRGGTNEILRGIIAGRLDEAGDSLRLDVDPDFAAMVDNVLARAGAEPATGFDAGGWARLAELGLTRLTAPEAAGGSGAGWAEAAVLHRAAGYHAIGLPLVEHDLLAGWLAEQVGPGLDDRVTTVALADEHGRLRAPYGRDAERLLLLTAHDGAWSLADVGADQVRLEPGADLAGRPRDLVLGALPGRPVADDVVAGLQLRGALARSVQLCGALDRAVEIAVEHARIREQFGRPLLRFQAVQILLADAASEAALAGAATRAAVETIAAGPTEAGEELERAVAVAKSCAAHAASVVVRNCHQVLGAIGFTTEHALHRFTGRLLTWRDDFGTRDHWDRRLAARASAPGAPVWPVVVGG